MTKTHNSDMTTLGASAPASAPPTLDEISDQLENIREIASLVHAGGDMEAVLDHITYAVCSHSTWRAASIMSIDRTTGFSELVTRHDPVAEGRTDLAVRWSLMHSPTRKVVENNEPLVINNAQQSEEFPEFRKDALARDYQTVVLVPLQASDQQDREMILSVHSKDRVDVTGAQLNFLLTISTLASIAVGNAKTLHAKQQFNTRLRHAVDLHSELMERVLAGCMTETIIGMVEATIPDPLLLIDLTTNTFFTRRSPVEDKISAREWDSLVRQPPIARTLTSLVQESEPNDFRHCREIDLSEWGIPALAAFIEPLLVGKETVGGLIIFPQRRKQDDLETLVAQGAKFALSAQLMRGHIQFLSESSAHSELFDRVFEHSWNDLQQIHSRANRLGINLDAPARLAIIGLETGNKQHMHHLHRVLDQLVRELCPGGVVVHHHSDFFVYLPGETMSGEDFEEAFSRRVIKSFQWTGRNPPVIAFSGICSQPEDFSAARQHCLRQLSIGRTFGRTGLVRQKDFGPYALLIPALDDRAIRAFIADTLGPVQEHDAKFSHSLLETISVYVDQGCRYQATSDALGIHVSTLRYRLRRLNELFGIDISDAETRFSLALALRLKAMLEIHGDDPPGSHSA